MDIVKKVKDLASSETFKKVFFVLVAVVAVLVIFQAGMFVGFKKASFSFGWGDNYYKTFGGHRDVRMMNQNDRKGFSPRQMIGGHLGSDFTNAYGAVGKVIKIALPNFVILDESGVEKIIVTDKETTVRQMRGEIKIENLKVNDFVVVIGSPNDKSEITARLVRLMPGLQNGQTATTTIRNR